MILLKKIQITFPDTIGIAGAYTGVRSNSLLVNTVPATACSNKPAGRYLL